MRIPDLHGVIDRRLLINYRVNPDVLQNLLPAPFHPKLVRGVGIAGICLIRLRDIRPAFVPRWLGLSSENAAHRIAVEWRDDTGRLREGVYVPRRDTSSRLNAFVGGRLFPGIHHHARFTVRETPDRFEVAMRSDDDDTWLAVRALLAAEFPKTSVFSSLQAASAFFESGALGYSATLDPRRFQGLELHCLNWQVEPLAVLDVQSSFFEDSALFPLGSVEFDCALLMRGIRHAWHACDDLSAPVEAIVPLLRPDIVGAHRTALSHEARSIP